MLILKQKSSELFTSSEGGAERMASAMGCPFLGRISVDPRVGRCTDSGLSYVDAYEDQPVAVQFLSLAKKVSDYCLGKKNLWTARKFDIIFISSPFLYIWK
jgi:hypothetical protein